jgi:hypothetical protein
MAMNLNRQAAKNAKKEQADDLWLGRSSSILY